MNIIVERRRQHFVLMPLAPVFDRMIKTRSMEAQVYDVPFLPVFHFPSNATFPLVIIINAL